MQVVQSMVASPDAEEHVDIHPKPRSLATRITRPLDFTSKTYHISTVVCDLLQRNDDRMGNGGEIPHGDGIMSSE